MTDFRKINTNESRRIVGGRFRGGHTRLPRGGLSRGATTSERLPVFQIVCIPSNMYSINDLSNCDRKNDYLLGMFLNGFEPNVLSSKRYS